VWFRGGKCHDEKWLIYFIGNSKELYVAETIVLCLRVQCDAR